MQLEISAETARKVDALLATGRFRNAEEVVVYALDAFEAERAYAEEVAALVDEGVTAMRDGRTREVSPNLADEIIAAGIERSSARLGRTG